MSDDFISNVLAWGQLAVDQDPFLDFDGLVRALPGVHPSDVARILGVPGTRFRNRKTPRTRSLIESYGDLPVPHPLDFDWRFSLSTINSLSAIAGSLVPSEGSIALLGTPSLFGSIRQGRPDVTLLLADGSTETAQAIALKYGEGNVFRCDLLTDSLPETLVDVVVADPPWYPEYFEAFVWTAGRMVRPGGHLLLCGPNLGTRPGAEAEWAKIEEYARSLGFERAGFEATLRYDTPPFEVNAIHAAGHPAVSNDWRTGCLATFVRCRMLPAPRTVVISDSATWNEVTVGGIRFRVRRNATTLSVDPELHELVAGDVLDSVSRRDLRRAEADVWTSGNRIFRSGDTQTLTLILRALAEGASSATYVEHAIGRKLNRYESDVVEASESQINLIVEVEQSEYAYRRGGLECQLTGRSDVVTM